MRREIIYIYTKHISKSFQKTIKMMIQNGIYTNILVTERLKTGCHRN